MRLTETARLERVRMLIADVGHQTRHATAGGGDVSVRCHETDPTLGVPSDIVWRAHELARPLGERPCCRACYDDGGDGDTYLCTATVPLTVDCGVARW